VGKDERPSPALVLSGRAAFGPSSPDSHYCDRFSAEPAGQSPGPSCWAQPNDFRIRGPGLSEKTACTSLRLR